MTLRHIVLAAAGAAMLVACASFEGLGTKSSLADANRLTVKATLGAAVKQGTPWPRAEWWKEFGDPQLDRLMEEALVGNPSLRLARARIDRAAALAGLANAARTPQVNGSVESTYQRFSENGQVRPPFAGSYRISSRLALDFSYELDFWGKNDAALQAALGDLKVAEAESQAARLLLASAVVRTYIQLDRQFQQLAIAQALLRQSEQLYGLTEQRVRAGLDTRVELEQTAAAIPAARAEIAAVNESIELLRHQLAALAGAGPDRGASIEKAGLTARGELALPAVLPADLIGRRPDVVASRWRVEAVARGIDSAKAQFYPNVNLVAFAGLQAIGLNHLFEAGSGIVGAGPALQLPVFDGGRLRSNLALRNADFDAAVEQYNATILDAVRDVADQVTSWRAVEARQAEAKTALARFEEAYRLAVLRYEAGLSTYLTVIGAEGRVLAQRRIEADLLARRLDVAADLARALGGGYQPGSAS